MTILDAAFWAVCLVLVASGATKVAEPQPFATAMASFGIPGAHHRSDGVDVPGRWLAIAAGVAEIAIGMNALVLGGRVVAALAAAAYVVFAAVVVGARRRGLASCGCFGARSGAPSAGHAAINVASAVVCAAAAVQGPVAVAVGLDALDTAAAAVVVVVVLGTAGAIVVADAR